MAKYVNINRSLDCETETFKDDLRVWMKECVCAWKYGNEIRNCQWQYLRASGWKRLSQQMLDTEYGDELTNDRVSASRVMA